MGEHVFFSSHVQLCQFKRRVSRELDLTRVRVLPKKLGIRNKRIKNGKGVQSYM